MTKVAIKSLSLLCLIILSLGTPLKADYIGAHLLVGYDPKHPTTDIFELIEDHHIAGIFFKGSNTLTPSEAFELTHQLQEHAKSVGYTSPLIIAADQEGGNVRRFRKGFSKLPFFRKLGAYNSDKISNLYGYLVGKEMMSIGVNMLLAPVLDVDSNPKNKVIHNRSLWTRPKRVATHGVLFMRGAQKSGIQTVIKHFPGHGGTELDSHTDNPKISKTFYELHQVELLPFKYAIQSGATSVMVNHVSYPNVFGKDIPATLTSITPAILRQRLRFKGVIMTDDMEMTAITSLLNPRDRLLTPLVLGFDLVLSTQDPKALHAMLDNIENDPLTLLLKQHLEEDGSEKRITHLRSQLSPAPETLDTTYINSKQLNAIITKLEKK